MKVFSVDAKKDTAPQIESKTNAFWADLRVKYKLVSTPIIVPAGDKILFIFVVCQPVV